MSCEPMPLAIEVNGVCKSYPHRRRPGAQLWAAIRGRAVVDEDAFHALRDISFRIAKGRTVGVIGRNGAGKSTLLQIICQTLQPTSGSVQVRGRIAALLELGAGFNPDFTGRENILLSGNLFGLSKQQMSERYARIVEFAEIGDFVDQPVKTYSSGMFVRLAFAVLAHVDADILVIDEALAVGDAYFTQKCMRFLHDFRQRGTLLFVSHDTGSVVSLCDEAIWIDHGRLLRQGPAKEVCESYLASLFGAENQAALDEAAPPAPAAHEEVQPVDARHAWISSSNLRNDLEVMRFSPGATRFGQGRARIVDVALFDEAGQPLAWVVGGERVRLRLRAHSEVPLSMPIMGFYLKNRLGQELFGDNTWLHTRQTGSAPQGTRLEAWFEFRMPYLPAGDYSFAVAIGDGVPADHVQHDWIHDALMIRAQGGPVSRGLIGLPMQSVTLQSY